MWNTYLNSNESFTPATFFSLHFDSTRECLSSLLKHREQYIIGIGWKVDACGNHNKYIYLPDRVSGAIFPFLYYDILCILCQDLEICCWGTEVLENTETRQREQHTRRSFRVFRIRMIRAESVMSRRSVSHCRRRRRTTAGFSTSCRISSLQCRMMTHIWRVLILLAVGPLMLIGPPSLQKCWPNSWSVWNAISIWKGLVQNMNFLSVQINPTSGHSTVSRQTTSAVCSKWLQKVQSWTWRNSVCMMVKYPTSQQSCCHKPWPNWRHFGRMGV